MGCDALQELSTDGRKLERDVCLVPHSSHLPWPGRIGPLSRCNGQLVYLLRPSLVQGFT